MSGFRTIYCAFLTLFERIEILLRDHYVLAYADYLHSDSALWRINVAYLCSCGEIGSARADEVILRVPLHLQRAAVENDSESSDDRSIRAGDVIGVLKEVNATCFEYKREEVRRTVCRVSYSVTLSEHQFNFCLRSLHRLLFGTRILVWLFPTMPPQKIGLGWVVWSTEFWRNISRTVRKKKLEYLGPI